MGFRWASGGMADALCDRQSPILGRHAPAFAQESGRGAPAQGRSPQSRSRSGRSTVGLHCMSTRSQLAVLATVVTVAVAEGSVRLSQRPGPSEALIPETKSLCEGTMPLNFRAEIFSWNASQTVRTASFTVRWERQ